jgi:CHAD domain-containing protein
MAYQLAPAEPTGDAVRRIAREEIEGALILLRGPTDPAGAIHEARKSFKRVRALLRLARSGMPSAAYRLEMDTFRDAGRLLADARDARVLEETVAALRADSDAVSEHAFSGLRAALAVERDSSTERAMGASAGVIEALREAATRAGDWEVDDDPGILSQGLRRAYRRGGARLEDVELAPTDEHLHEWRKRVKDLWYHLTLIEAAWPELLGPTGDLAHQLSDHLGDDHDLAVLAGAADARPGAFETPAEHQLLVDLIRRRRAGLQEQAWPLGRRLYAERPKAYARRTGCYLTLWRQEG